MAPCFIFPASTNVPAHDFLKNTNPAPRLGVSYDLTGKGRTVLKAFYGRYYNNLADGFSAANPGDIRQATFNFIDVHGDQRYHGPENLGTLRSRTGGADAPIDPNMKTPYAEEISGSFETQLPGESAVRVTYVRKNQRNTAPFFTQNLNQNRSENVSLVNLRFDKGFSLGGRTKLTGMFDIYNLLNRDPVTNFNMIAGGSYKTVIAVLDPRVFQIGARFEF